jgi:outer membrane lipoprotein-sorting protein
MIYRILFFICFSISSYSLEHLCQKIQHGSVLQVKFTQQKKFSSLPKPIISKGDLILWNGQGLLWRTTTPFNHILLITKKGLFSLDGDRKQSLMKGNEQEQYILNLLTKLLNGQFKDITEFKVEIVSESQSKKNWTIQLTPLGDMQKFISKINVSGTQVITNISIIRTNGDCDVITLTDHNLNPKLPECTKELFHD